MAELTGSRELLNEVVGRFRIHGTNLTKWCKENGIKEPNARVYLLGERNGPKAKEWRQRIVNAARKEGT
jgi:hypothetical protein